MALQSLLIFTFSSFVSLSKSDRTTFDCKMRELAMEYAHKIQPFRTRQQFQQIADALNGAEEAQNCNVTVPLSLHYNSNRIPSFTLPQSGVMVYVDAAKGSDSNSGTLQEPLKTIAKAVMTAQEAGSPSTILLRKGTYFLGQTIALSSADNELSIQNYDGEEAWISGGIPVQPLWKPYNMSTNSSWIVQQKENAIYGDHPTLGRIAINGTYDSWRGCEAMCKANGSCTAWTWHDQTQPGSYKYQCWFRFDGVYKPTPEAGHVSGFRQVAANIYVADLSGIVSVPGLRINGKRAIRARYPNADPETGFGSNLEAKKWSPPNIPLMPDKEINPDTPLRTTSNSFQKYQIGVGGTCKQLEPPAGFWCGNNTNRSTDPRQYLHRHPSGMIADRTVLPNSPYKNVTGAVVQTWRPAHWFTMMFEVDDYEPSTGKFSFGRGGFQGGEGVDSGAEFYIENIMEELDSPNEYYFDERERKLYFFYNGTGKPPPDTSFVVTNLKTLFTVRGSQDTPAKGISFKGVGFRDTAYTYMDPHGMPSGGDWTLERMGAMLFEGTVDTLVDSCLFERLDGNGVMISGYNRNVTVQLSEFVWIGNTAIASWGYTRGTEVEGMGWDGTDGNQPRFNRIMYNFVHELGIWQKQSSLYFQSQSCQNLVQGNIFFNGPRAGINFNDGFGGGSNLTENLLLNTCRESGDHGPFNSWDRQVYVTKVRDGMTASTIKAYDMIFNNFIIANYHSSMAIDNDDGSCYYRTFGNFFVYSGSGMKNDFGGHDNDHHDNIYAYVGKGFGICSQLEGHVDYFYNNTVVMTGDGDYGNPACSGPGKTVVHDNKIYTPHGNVTECRMPLKEWQAKGNDPGTVAGMWPEDEAIINLARQILKF